MIAGTPVLIAGKLVCVCACGGTIVAAPTDRGIRYAVSSHVLTGRHQEWRWLGDAFRDPEMAGRVA